MSRLLLSLLVCYIYFLLYILLWVVILYLHFLMLFRLYLLLVGEPLSLSLAPGNPNGLKKTNLIVSVNPRRRAVNSVKEKLIKSHVMETP